MTQLDTNKVAEGGRPSPVSSSFKSGFWDRLTGENGLQKWVFYIPLVFMALFFALLKPGGILDVEVPLFPQPAAVQDPTHLSFWKTFQRLP